MQREKLLCDVHTELNKHTLPMIQNRENWLTQAFSFKTPSLTSGPDGCVYEMRTYHLYPGHLLEWERSWREGLEARRVYAEPSGAWFARVGTLHTVFHVWKYSSMEERARVREAAWQAKVGALTQTASHVQKQASEILRPL